MAYTLRLSSDEAFDLDELVLDLRRASRRRRLDKSTMIKALLSLTDTNPDVRAALIEHLRTDQSGR